MARKRNLSLTAERFSPAWWLGSARNFFWVAVITLMIWVYADLEMSEPREFTATLRLTLSKAQQTVIVGDTDAAVTFSAKGSRRAMAQFERWLVDNDEIIEIDLSAYAPSFYSIPVVQLLNQAPDIVQQGLEVRTATPTALEFTVGKLESRQVRVVFNSTGATLAEGAAIEPHEVTVTAAASEWRRIDEQGEPLEVQTAREDLSLVRPGQAGTRRVSLVSAIGGVPVELSEGAVTVTFRILQQNEEITRAVPVRIISPVSWATDDTWQEYVLLKKDATVPWRPEITISGARTDLEKLRVEDIYAFIELTEDDKAPVESWLQRAVEVQLPPQLQLEVVGEMPTVQFKLVRREP